MQDFGHLPVKTMPRAFVFELRDKYADTPRKANYIVQILRRLMSWAVDRGWRSDNPVLRPRQLRAGAGHRPWEEAEIARFRAAWPTSAVQRVAFELLLNTGQRGGDVIQMTRATCRDGWVTLRQKKTRERLSVPQTPELTAVLESWLSSHHHAVILTTPAGRPLKVDYFRHLMRKAYCAAGLPDDCTSHGLRYTAATRLREVGCDWQTIGAITGHRTAEMARKYSERRRLAELGMGRLLDANKP